MDFILGCKVGGFMNSVAGAVGDRAISVERRSDLKFGSLYQAEFGTPDTDCPFVEWKVRIDAKICYLSDVRSTINLL